MNTKVQENRCPCCKKLFCCVNCRDIHERKKHPRPKTDTDCNLCLSKKLPFEKFSDAKLLCHLVIRHLPLICVLCGQLYRNSSDLENFTKCEYWERKNNRYFLPRSDYPVKKLSAQTTPSPITKTISCPAIRTKDSPSFESTEFHSLQSFTSPPELIRHTSTPMHVGAGVHRTNPQFSKTPKVPIFSYKTPAKTPTILKSTPGNNKSSEQNNSPTLFYSATSQLLLNSKEINSENCTPASIHSNLKSFIGGDTPSRSGGNSREFTRLNSGRMLEVMEEQEEQVSINMNLTEVQDHLTPGFVEEENFGDASKIAVKDSGKKVRFSDQDNQIAADSTVDAVSDSEEFYEAQDIPGEKSIQEINNKSDAQITRENRDNSDKENLGNKEDSKVFKTPASPPPAATSSRVVMMVVVENVFDISSSKLVPIVNTNLEKIDQCKSLAETISSSISNISSQIQSTSNGIERRSVTSVDSLLTSSTVEYYSKRSASSSTSAGCPSGNSGGIFSAMAQAVRHAFRGLPGTGTSKSPQSSRVQESITERKFSVSGGSSTTSPSGGFSSIATSLLRRPGKRSRDTINDPAFAHHREIRSPRNETGSSPVAKRPRSWHRIRGRDPIARMRRDNPSTTRGVSSETQHFQQGSLSVGDTILPLPSRAHQSTQTE